MENTFDLISAFAPSGDQPRAIADLAAGVERGDPHQVLLGVTGSGKTFSMAHVIATTGRPALVIAHNKTLAAQLYDEFRSFFPNNAVEYFVSYYDYYQPEAYLPKSGTYIEKDAQINDEIDRMRHAATMALIERRDVVIVASVSCIYGLGAPDFYKEMRIPLHVGQRLVRDDLLERLVEVRYSRNNVDFARGTFRVNGDTVQIIPIYQTDTAIRIEFFGDEIDDIALVDSLTGKVREKKEEVSIYPGTHYVTTDELKERALVEIEAEMRALTPRYVNEGKLIEAQRIEERTLADLEMIKAIGYCNGIENYSRYLSGRQPGDPPPTLLEYLPDDALIIIDESHQTVSQIGAMYKGDRSRKKALIDYGFRLPSALDNRPLCFEEFEKAPQQRIYVSATPADYELEKSEGVVVEQVVRPTGLVDPEVTIRPVEGQVDDLSAMIRERAERGQRTLVACMTKRQAEDLTDYYQEMGLRVRYLHSDIVTLERMEIIRELRLGAFDALIGINLLREGLDIPEVGLVAILNADMEGFLRSQTALIQTAGRAARNVEGSVVFFADRVTGSMKRALDEMSRRRKRQLAYNKKEGITPESVKRTIGEARNSIYEKEYVTVPLEEEFDHMPQEEMNRLTRTYETAMKKAAQDLDFETAARYRDKIHDVRQASLSS